MLAYFKQFFDLNDFSLTVSEAQTLASSNPEVSFSASWGDISENLAILASFLGQIIRFFTTALGWLGGWGVLLLVVAFFALSFLNFLSPFRRSNYILVLILTDIYGYTSGVPISALGRFSLVMMAPALVSALLYFLAWLVSFVTKKKNLSSSPSMAKAKRRQVPLRYLRQQRRVYISS
jgi:hypothetical protein